MTKPFNLADAKAGHPVQTVAGDRAEVFKYDHAKFANFPLVGVINNTRLCYWTESGAGALGVGDSYQDNLVMAPIGMIDGKPVFIGDEFEQFHPRADGWIKQNATPKCSGIDFSKARWPVSAPVYPTTQMKLEDFDSALSKSGSHECISASAACAIANAALRHAIDAGQVVLPSAAVSDDLLMKVAKAVIIEMRGLGGMAVYGFNENNCKSIIASVTGTKDAKERAQ